MFDLAGDEISETGAASFVPARTRSRASDTRSPTLSVSPVDCQRCRSHHEAAQLVDDNDIWPYRAQLADCAINRMKDLPPKMSLRARVRKYEKPKPYLSTSLKCAYGVLTTESNRLSTFGGRIS
jgi:hypothetical protein